MKKQWFSFFTSFVAICLSFPSSALAVQDSVHTVAGRSLVDWAKDLPATNMTTRLRAAKTIGIFGAEAIPLLGEMLAHDDPSVRYWAASHLGNIGEESTAVKSLLTKSAEDDSPHVRMAAAYALCRVDSVDRWHGLLLEGINSKKREVGCCAADFLARLGPAAKPQLPLIEAKYAEYLKGGDYHIRGAIENAVKAIRDDGMLENHKRPTGGGNARGPGAGKVVGPAARSKDEAQKRPNILWISCEDISSNLGCYGDEYASTPNLDKLATEGVRYTHAFTPAGVCAVVRTGMITGMYPISFGGQHMRSVVPFPEGVRPFPEYLREAGYFCTNKSKTDYQSKVNLAQVWDRQGNTHSDWRERKAGQPFFSVINLTCSHESQIRHGEKTHAAILNRLQPHQRHDADAAAEFLPPIYPNTSEARKDWAWYSDNISEMDRQVGEILERLDADRLTENTVVIFWSDHGRGLPRGKRWIYDSGVRVPVIVRWPGQLPAGTANDELVSTEDLTATTLSLAGVTPKEYMHGRVILGEAKASAPEMLFFHRDRMDEAYELMRAARDHRFKYIRNYEPERTYAQHIDYMDMMPTLVDLRRMHAAGELNPVQDRFFSKTKPVEELYDVVADPHETVNLAARAEYRETLQEMRAAVEEWQNEIGDMGLIPEPIMMDMLRAERE
jgi:N-sulfoglucosamine sulfohydrolase